MKSFFLFGFACLLSISSIAQNPLPDNFHYSTLENGMEVLVIEDPSVPLATIELVVRNGAYCETPEYDGLSHLYEHMFFKANKDYPSQEAFMEKVNEMGAVFNGTTSTDRVNYYITVGNHNLNEGLKFMNSAIRYPLFDKVEMEKENHVVDGEFERNESNPSYFLYEKLQQVMWGDLFSRKNTIGDHDIIKTATPEKMRVVQKKYYYPNNTLLAVAGDVDPKEVLAMAEAIYGDWEPSDFDPFEKWPIPEFEPLKGESRFIVENENVRVPYIQIGWHGPDTRNDAKSTYVADVFSYILGQKTSKFTKDFVDSGLTYGGGLSYYTNKYTGPISLTVVPNPEEVEKVLGMIEEHIAMWDDDDYFTDEQLEVAINQLAISDLYGQEKTSSFVHNLTFWWATADLDYYNNYHENLTKVTRQDIKEYVRKYIQTDNRVMGLLLTAEMREQLGVADYFETNVD